MFINQEIREAINYIFNYIKSNKKYFLFESFISAAFIISYFIYYLSLESCLDGEEICGNNMKWIYKKLFQLILSSELISFLVIITLYYNASKLHLMHLITIFVLIFFLITMECTILFFSC